MLSLRDAHLPPIRINLPLLPGQTISIDPTPSYKFDPPSSFTRHTSCNNQQAEQLIDFDSREEDRALHPASRYPPVMATTKIYIVYYSTWGHVATLAEEIKKGADAVEGVETTIWRVPETLPEEVLGKLHAAPAREDHPVITAAQLAEADGVLFGFPTRFGMMAAQMKAFFDSTGGLWQAQSLAGKPAGVFFATATQGGGQETTALTAVTQLTHHGMLFVPVGYTFGAGMFGMDEVQGGSPYGAGTYAGADGSRLPSDAELGLAAHQGKYFAGVAKKLKAVAV